MEVKLIKHFELDFLHYYHHHELCEARRIMSASSTAKRALFVIDVQRDLADDPKTQVPDANVLRETLTTLIERVRRANAKAGPSSDEVVRLIFVQHSDSNPDDALAKGKPSWQLVFPPNEHEGDWLVQKTHRDTFTSNPTLADRLRTEGLCELIMCGTQSECCVRSTTLGALQNGFERVTLLSGAHSTYPHEGEVRRTLEEIKSDVEREVVKAGGLVTPWQMWLESLLR